MLQQSNRSYRVLDVLMPMSSLILYYIIIKELYPCLFVEGKMTFHLLITQWKNEARYKPFDLLHQHVSKVW